MIGLELKKLWNLPMVLLALLCLGLTVGEAATAGKMDRWQPDSSLYEWYLEQYEGRLNRELLMQIEREQEKMETLPEEAVEMERKYRHKEITWKEFSEFQNGLNYITSHQPAFDRMLMDVQYLQLQEQLHPKVHLALFNQKYWNYYFQTGTLSYWLLFLVVLLALRSFFLEKSSRMLPLLKAGSAGMEGMTEWKMAAVGISAGGAALLSSLTRFISFLTIWKLPCLDASVWSLPVFASVGISMNLLCAALMSCLLQTVGAVLLALLIFGIALLCEQEIVTALAGLLLLLLPKLVSLPWLQRIGLFSLFNGTEAVQGTVSWGSAVLLLLIVAGWMAIAELLVQMAIRRG